MNPEQQLRDEIESQGADKLLFLLEKEDGEIEELTLKSVRYNGTTINVLTQSVK